MKLTKENKTAYLRLKKAWLYYQSKYGKELIVERKYFSTSKLDDHWPETIEHYFLIRKEDILDVISPLSSEPYGFNTIAHVSLFIIDANDKVLKNQDGIEFEINEMDKLLYLK